MSEDLFRLTNSTKPQHFEKVRKMRKTIRQLLAEKDFSEYDNDSGEPFWGNMGAGVLAFCAETKRFLIDHRSKYVNEPHTFNVYGGKVDEKKGENLKQAVRREFREETGYADGIILIPLYVYKTKGFEYHNFLGLIDHEFKPKNSWESQGHAWVTWNELLRLPSKHFGLKILLNYDKEKIRELTKEH